MGNTTQNNGLFASWLRETLLTRKMRVMDLARQIARDEGFNEQDKDDFRRRTKAIHGNISNVLKGVSDIGFDYCIKIADAFMLPHESVLRIASLLPEEKNGERVVPATTRGKIDALLAVLTPEEQDEAIRFLTSFTSSQIAERLQAKPKKTKLKRA